MGLPHKIGNSSGGGRFTCLLAGLTSSVVLMIAVAPKIFRFARNPIVPAIARPISVW